MPYCSERSYRNDVAPARLARASLAALALLSLLGWAMPASAQVKRCERSDGTAAFTDRRCSEIDAIERAPPRDRPGSRRIYRGGCARNVQDLLFEMTTAIDGGDANRLASVYHWAGMSSGAAIPVMKRLDAVVQRPLVDIVPVLPAAPQPSGLSSWSAADSAPASDFGGDVDVAGGPAVAGGGYQYPSTVDSATGRAPVALRVVQTLDNGSSPSETVFELQRHFGCVWIKGG